MFVCLFRVFCVLLDNMKNTLFTYLFCCFYLMSLGQTSLIKTDTQGNLTYYPDADGFVLPDFSHAGYRGGGVEIPFIPVVKTISAISGDNTAHIQAAIDEIGKLPENQRGAILLKKGKYEINGTIYVKYSGIVLRGEGNTESGTFIYAKGNVPNQRDVIVIGNTSQNKWSSGKSNQQNITDNTVPAGAMSFSVSNASAYKAGDLIAIYHPCTEAWLNAVNYGGVPAASGEQWEEGQVPIIYHRYITSVTGNKITIDAPFFYTFNKNLSQSYIYKFSASSILKEIGIENLRVDIESLGGEDENHAWQAIRFLSCENCWAKNVITKGFGQSGFITDCCTRTTIENCQAIDPVSIITGERRYNFNTYTHSQLILFKNCYARNGRHHYISNGMAYASGNVFLNCTSDAINNANEGHRQWTQGMLYDNHKEVNLIRDFVLGLYNRVDMGTGHGWAATHSVLWNCDVTSTGVIGLQKPPTAQNYAIGCTAKSITGKPVSSTNFPIGYIESQNKPIQEIPSLYEAQLKARTQSTGIKKNEYNDQIKISTQKGNIQIQIPAEILPVQIKLWDVQGRLLNRKIVDHTDVKISTTYQGFAFVQVIKNNEQYTQKISIQ